MSWPSESLWMSLSPQNLCRLVLMTIMHMKERGGWSWTTRSAYTSCALHHYLISNTTFSSTKLNNVVGAAETREGRCIAFPNSYQHRVSPFQLVDPSKPGHRKILALFLVDPSIQPIPSTTNVPPQQASWAIQALGTTDPRAPVHRLPIELVGMIKDESGLMDEREAKEVRLELMKERTTVLEQVVEDSDNFLFSRVFNLCEH